MKFFHHAAPWRLVESACSKLPFYGVAGTVNFTAECACFLVALLPNPNEAKSRTSPAY
jgi:hypothetical protein